MLSQTGQYALRAVVYLAEARRKGENVSAARVAERAGLPQNYLSKVLYALVQAGVVDSTRGPHGGFRLVRPASEVTVADVLEPFESIHRGECMLSRTECPHGARCGSRPRCRTLSAEIDHFLRTTRIADLLRLREAGR